MCQVVPSTIGFDSQACAGGRDRGASQSVAFVPSVGAGFVRQDFSSATGDALNSLGDCAPICRSLR